MKKSHIYILLVIVVLLIILAFVRKDKKVDVVDNTPTPQAVGMCYQYSKENYSGTFDKAWLKMNIVGDKVTGEYRNLPAEKDSKTGKFIGTVGKMDPKISGRIADVWWDSSAEGMTVKEQLHIEFGEGSAVALFGEMVDKGDGTYVYKDTTKLTPGFQMSQVDCNVLDEQVAVEQYVRANISTITPEKAVLGGSWYVTSIDINTSAKTGRVTYEDGHIEGSKNFSYAVNNGEVKISLINKSTPAKPEDKPVTCTMDAMQCPDGSYVGRTGPNCTFVCPAPKTDPYNRYISNDCKTVSGCNGPISCVDKDSTAGSASVCISLPEFACYKTGTARCEKQSSGKCDWTQTPELQSCLKNAKL